MRVIRADSVKSAKPYKAMVKRGGQAVALGYFATAKEAALCVGRSVARSVAVGRGRRRRGRRQQRWRRASQQEGDEVGAALAAATRAATEAGWSTCLSPLLES